MTPSTLRREGRYLPVIAIPVGDRERQAMRGNETAADSPLRGPS